jgi:hypothetical protein
MRIPKTSWRPALWSVLVGALVAACGPVEVREDATGAWTPIPPGSTLTLNRPVQIPQERARIFFRGGEISAAGANMGPSCGLEVREMSMDGPQTVQAGTYRITRVEDYWPQVAWREPPEAVRFRLASSSQGGSPMIQQGYHLYLEGGPDPNVMRLTCLGMLDVMWKARSITLAEIRQALGSVADLKLAGSASR